MEPGTESEWDDKYFERLIPRDTSHVTPTSSASGVDYQRSRHNQRWIPQSQSESTQKKRSASSSQTSTSKVHFLFLPNFTRQTQISFLSIVAHRTRQFESWLADRLENFTIHQEGQISRIPKQVRSMTMREFGEKYQGNIQAALRGYQKERLVAAGTEANFGEIDKSMRKRKWVEGIEAEMEKNNNKDGEPPRAAKTGMCTNLLS